MSANKTVENDRSVITFLNSVKDEERRKDGFHALEMMNDITGVPPKMWGGSIVGYGTYHYRYDSGREGDFFKAGFSPRKNSMTFYIMSGFPEYEDLLSFLGKHKLGKSCLYIKSLEDVDSSILRKIIKRSYEEMNKKYHKHE